MKKRVISAVAAMTLLTTGAFAFESLTNGTIVTKKTEGIEANWFPTPANTLQSAYTAAVPAGANLELSTTVRGDALIYPIYSNKEGIRTEMVVRNTKKEKAVVVKIVLYSADSTREIMDFNVYLSGNDVFKFWVEDGLVKTKDGSIMKQTMWPNLVPAARQGTVPGEGFVANKHGEELTIGKKLPADVKMGYAAAYAMAETGLTATDNRATGVAFHKKHVLLATEYRDALDIARPGWRQAYDTTRGLFKNGLMVNTGGYAVNAPNQASPTTTTAVNKATITAFTDPVEDILTGTVKIVSKTSGAEADMLLPATALKNFTDHNVILWTEGEYAAIQDRRILAGGRYDAAGIQNDARAFEVSKGFYTFEKDTQNQIIFTQPFKRILVQLNPRTGYGYYENVAGKYNYSGFRFTHTMYNENEDFYTATPATPTPTVITSPFNSNVVHQTISTLDEEVAVIKDFKSGKMEADLQNNPDYKGFFGKAPNQDGWGYIYFPSAKAKIPAIVTQYVGSKVGGKSMMNWIYTPVER